MPKNNETIAAILAEMREFTNMPYEGLDRAECRLLDKIDDYADRIEAAAKRGQAITDAMLAVKDKSLPHPDPEHAPPLFAAPDNAAALREALEQAKRDHWFDMSPELRNKIFAALSAPPRNCDIGTKDKQKERFKAFCEERDCHECPFYGNPDCPLDWAQMPFAPEKGASK